MKSIKESYMNEALNCISNPQRSFVYFIQVDSAGFDSMIKIGLSIDPIRRFNEIVEQVDNGNYKVDWLELGSEQIRLVGYIEGGRNLEKALHNAFKDWSMGREWFILSDDLDAEIDGLLCDWCICDPCLEADCFSGACSEHLDRSTELASLGINLVETRAESE